MTIVLGANQYGKAENRLVRVYRDTARHEIRDLNVSSSLRGDFSDAHITGDQAAILPTDTQKNTVFAFAKEKGVRSIEEFALTLGDHFIHQTPKATGARIEIEEYFWDRISIDGAPHDHSFVRNGGETRTTVVTVEGRGADRKAWASPASRTWCSPRPPARNSGASSRTSTPPCRRPPTASWPPRSSPAGVTTPSMSTSTSPTSRSGPCCSSGSPRSQLRPAADPLRDGRVRSARNTRRSPRSGSRPRTSTISWSTFRRSADENPGEVFFAADRPYGLIEAAVERDDASDPGSAWNTVPGFC